MDTTGGFIAKDRFKRGRNPAVFGPTIGGFLVRGEGSAAIACARLWAVTTADRIRCPDDGRVLRLRK